MAEKKIIDDYYSQVSSNTTGEEEKKEESKKAKIKAKKIVKKVVKKKEEKANKTETKNVSAISSKSKIEKKDIKDSALQQKQTKKKKIIQKIEVVKKVEQKNVENKKIKVVKKAELDKNKELEQNKDNNKVSGNKTKQNFKKKDKKKQNIKNKNEEEVKKTKKTGKNKTRGRFKFFHEEEKEITFTRSNKLKQTKKQEKKLEDIKQNLVSKAGEEVVMPEVFSLKEFSEKIGVALVKLIAEFMKNGMMVNINSKIDFDSASIIAEVFDVKLVRDNSKGVSVKDLLSGNIEELLKEDDPEKLKPRAPVVSIMGHVDHGKTSLLDKIRKTKVADSEAGGITQSIGAYQVEHNGQKITFLDTPGHEAFTVMRARGAKSTDIAILVVAADEGVKPQTIESISHAKEAGIPVIVAINKMDKEGANPDHVKGQLAEHGLTPEDWGGDTPMIPVSAKTGFGIDELLEMLLLVAEMKELKANPDRAGIATVIESHLDKKLGPVATVLINTGTINKGDSIVCNDSYGKIRIMKNFENKGIVKAFPGDPILIIGLDKVVAGGDILQVVSNISIAKEKAQEYAEIKAQEEKNKASGLDILMSRIKAGNLKQLKVLIKADTNGSLEAIKASVQKLSTNETNIVIIHSGVGDITEGDAIMADSSKAIIIGFNVGIIESAKKIIEKEKIEVISSKVIYHITERIEKIITGMLDPKEVEISLCRAKVGGIFYNDKKFKIVGLIISGEDEKIENNTLVRVIRKDKKIGEGKITSLKQGVEEVKELQGPTECGVRFEGKADIEIGDYFEVYKIEIKK